MPQTEQGRKNGWMQRQSLRTLQANRPIGPRRPLYGTLSVKDFYDILFS